MALEWTAARASRGSYSVFTSARITHFLSLNVKYFHFKIFQCQMYPFNLVVSSIIYTSEIINTNIV